MIAALIAFGVIFAVIFLQRFIYIKFAFKNLALNYYFSQTEVNEGDIFYITEVIENKKYLPLPAVSTILEAGAGLAFADAGAQVIDQKSVFCFYTVGPYKKITRTWRIKAVKRGRFNINSITVSLRDIFGLVRISNDFLCSANVLVLPVGYPTNKRVASLNLTGGERSVLTGYYTNPFEIQKIVPYTYSEPLNKINWKASAKTQTLMINAEQPSVAEKILVVLDTSEKYLLEKNIKICATLSKLLSEENEVTLMTNGRLPENYSNPLVKLANPDYLITNEFNICAHERNFKRLLAEIIGGYDEYYNIACESRKYADKIEIEKLAENIQKKFFRNNHNNSVILVKGGKIYDYESNQNIFV
jgi:uncharacterized protein (DUF58 family)